MHIGELFVLGFSGPTVPQWLETFSQNYGLGGVILFDYSCQKKAFENNIYTPQQTKDLCHQIHALPSNPLLFVDQEGGRVRRLKESAGFAPLPSQQEIATYSESEKYRILRQSYAELKELGFHMNFAPVIDVNSNPENPNIGRIERAYSSNIDEVRENALILNQVAREMGIGLCLKHFPGIGGAHVDSHEELMDITDSLDEAQVELFYELAANLHGDAILLSHAYVKQWDQAPVSLSSTVVKMMRERLSETLLITDDIQMQGLQKTHSSMEICQSAIAAGLDMICIGNNLINEEAAMLTLAEDLISYVNKHSLTESVLESIQRVRSRKALLTGA